MNHNRHFDDHIKEQFNNFSPDVHPHLWENIVAEKDRKRPAGFWVSIFTGRNKLLVLGLFIALSSGGAWVYYNNTYNGDDVKNDLTHKEVKSGKSDNSQIAPAISIPDEPTNRELLATNDDEATQGKPTDGGDYDLADRAGISSDSKRKMKVQIHSPAMQSDHDEKPAAKKGFTHKKMITGLANVLVNTTSPEMAEADFDGDGTLLGRLRFNAEKYTVQRVTGKKMEPKFNPVVYLPDCPIEKDASGNKKYFEFYAGPDYAFKSLQDTGNSAYLQKRKESTSFLSAYSAGVRYTKVFNNSMSIRGGVNYSQINEKFTLYQGNVVTVVYTINSNGDTIGSYTTTGTRYKKTINRYRSIDIPLVVGYEIGNGRLHANINAGAIINIYSWQKGDVLDPAGNPVSITTGKNPSPYQFKTNAGVGFIGAVSVYYKLNDRLHIMAEPYFRYNFTPMSKEGITLKQKYQTAGLRLGIRLDL